MQVRHLRTSKPLVKLVYGAYQCHANMVAWTFLTSYSLCYQSLLQLLMLASKTFGHCSHVSTRSTSSVMTTNANAISHAFVQAKPCQWTSPNQMLVPTSSALCSRQPSMRRRTAGDWMVWSDSLPMVILISTSSSPDRKRAHETDVACLCSYTISAMEALMCVTSRTSSVYMVRLLASLFTRMQKQNYVATHAWDSSNTLWHWWMVLDSA